MQTHEKETQLAIMFCVLSPLSPAKASCYPSLKTTTRGLIVGFFDLKHMSVNHYPVPLSAADTISSAGPPPPQKKKRLWQTNLADSLGPDLARQNV